MIETGTNDLVFIGSNQLQQFAVSGTPAGNDHTRATIAEYHLTGTKTDGNPVARRCDSHTAYATICVCCKFPFIHIRADASVDKFDGGFRGAGQDQGTGRRICFHYANRRQFM